MKFLLLLAGSLAFAQSHDYQLFLLIGQSNMAGRGQIEAMDREPIPRVLMLNKELEWVSAVDPVHFDRPNIAGVGIARTFGRVLAAANPSATIGLIPAAVGGTSLTEWKPDGKLYADAVRRARAAMKNGRLRGILWHQGEGDSTEEMAPTYRDRFADFISRLRADLDAADVPVVVGELGEYMIPPAGKRVYARVVNEQLALIPLKVPHSGFVSSAGLMHKGDGTHFDSPSAREFGRRYALAFMALDPTWATLPLSAAVAQPGTVKQIVPGVWFREGEPEMSHANNIIIEMKDYLVVVDANYPSGAQAVIDDAKKLSSKPIKYVIDTHADPDHAYGNIVFTRLGATTIGYVGMLGDIKRVEPQTWKQVAGWNKSVAALNQPGPEPPKVTYSESPYVITDGKRRIELYHFTFGHTRGDTFIYLPNEKVLCTGDAVVNGPFSDPKHSNMGNWPNEVRAAKKLDVKYVLPGHGPDGGSDLLDGQIRFFETLNKAVQTAIREGKTLDQIVTLRDGRPMATSIRLPKDIMDKYVFPDKPDLKAWQIMRFPTQVRNTYEEIRQGKPWGIIADGE